MDWKYARCSSLIGAPSVPAPFSGPVANTMASMPASAAAFDTSYTVISVPIDPTRAVSLFR